jgi:hypothetical protein
MIDVPLIDELREVRRRLADGSQGDVVLYAQMLREKSRVKPGNYVSRPLLPPRPETPPSLPENIPASR